METVKNYKLSGGRGTISSWFANSFLSNSARGLNEEWSATILHGDIYVVRPGAWGRPRRVVKYIRRR